MDILFLICGYFIFDIFRNSRTSKSIGMPAGRGDARGFFNILKFSQAFLNILYNKYAIYIYMLSLGVGGWAGCQNLHPACPWEVGEVRISTLCVPGGVRIYTPRVPGRSGRSEFPPCVSLGGSEFTPRVSLGVGV